MTMRRHLPLRAGRVGDARAAHGGASAELSEVHLATGPGTAMVVEEVTAPMELKHQPYRDARTLEEYVGEARSSRWGRTRGGRKSRRRSPPSRPRSSPIRWRSEAATSG